MEELEEEYIRPNSGDTM